MNGTWTKTIGVILSLLTVLWMGARWTARIEEQLGRIADQQVEQKQSIRDQREILNWATDSIHKKGEAFARSAQTLGELQRGQRAFKDATDRMSRRLDTLDTSVNSMTFRIQMLEEATRKKTR